MTDSTDSLIAGLVEDLQPVRPVVPLRVALGLILAVAMALMAFVLIPQPSPLGASRLGVSSVYLVSFLGLVVMAVAGAVAAVASGRPGRERLAVRGGLVFAVGLTAALVICGWSMFSLGLTFRSSPAGWDAMCFQQSLRLSILPAGVVGFLVLRGWVMSPLASASIVLASAGAVGGLVVHLSCPFIEPQHLLLGHVSVPLALAVVGFYPLGRVLRRLRG